MEKLAITVSELSKVLGIDLNAAYNMIHIDGFPSIKAGKKYIIPLSGLKKWLDEAGGKEN